MVSVDSETDLFALFADETRAAILDALAARQRDHPRDPALSFSELREGVGRRDSGNFDYHLGKLRGRFVERTDEGYRLVPEGGRVAAALVSVREGEPFERSLTDPCPFCDGPLVLRHERGVVTVACDDGHEFSLIVPQHVTADRSPAAAVEAVAAVGRRQVGLLAARLCPLCYGRLGLTLERPVGDGEPLRYYLVGTCDGCGISVDYPPALAAFDDLTVRTFYDRHGVDVESRPFWTHPLLAADAYDFEAEPRQAVFADARDGETLEVVVDADGSVASVDVS